MKNSLFKILFGFICAILISDCFILSSAEISFLFATLLSFFILWFIRPSSIYIFVIIFLSGFLLHALHQYRPNTPAGKTIRLQIVSNVEDKKYTKRVLAKMRYLNPKMSFDDYCWIYLAPNHPSLKLIKKDCIIETNIALKELMKSDVPPYNFDYIHYQKRKRIFYSTYLSNSHFAVSSDLSNTTTFYDRIHEYLSNCIIKSVHNKKNAAIANSLILGDRTHIDIDILETYSKIGIIHLLSVSGLHVGVFVLLINFVFSRIKPKIKWIRLSVIISFLIIYAIISGGSIPVLRCAIMFGIIEMGKLIRRDASTFNSLGVSALGLLLFNTQYLFDIGFQLSYLALIGILLLSPSFIRTLSFNNWISKSIWKITCSTLSAWLFTFPLVLFYFHNMALLGNMANIIAIPLSAIILYSGLSLFIFSSIDCVLAYHGHILDFFISILNHISYYFYSIPYSFIDNVYISKATMTLLYVMLFFLLFYLKNKKIHLIKWSLVAMLLININLFIENHHLLNKKFLCFYHAKNAQLITIKERNKMYYYLTVNDSLLKKQLLAQQQYYKIDTLVPIDSPYFRIFNKNILLLRNQNLDIPQTDYLISCAHSKFVLSSQLTKTKIKKAFISYPNKGNNLLLSDYQLMNKKNQFKLINEHKFALIEF